MNTLTSNELSIFKAVCEGSGSVHDLIERHAVKRMTAYDNVKKLQCKGLLQGSGSSARLAPSLGLDAQALREYVFSQKYPLEAISGAKLLILLSLLAAPKTVERVSFETKLKKDSVRTLTNSLMRYALIRREGGMLSIPGSSTIHGFLADYSRGNHLSMVSRDSIDGVLLWHDGLQAIFSAKGVRDGRCLFLTGISAMRSYGLDLYYHRNYYHHGHWCSEPDAVDVTLHTILAGQGSRESIGDAILFIKKVGIDPNELMDRAGLVNLGARVGQIVKYIRGGIIDESTLPSPDELARLFGLYGVDR